MDAETPTGTSDDDALRVDDLVALVRRLEQTIVELQVENARLKGQLADRDGQHPTQRLEDEYSLEAEDKRDAAKRSGGKRRKKQKSSRRGRRTTEEKLAEEKLAEAHRHEDVFPEDVTPDDCTLHLSRVVWRIENGQAVLVAYHVYRGPGGEVPTIPGTLGRSECGIEIYVALTFMVFIVRLSMDKVCQQLEFFWGLKLAKSQADTQRVLIYRNADLPVRRNLITTRFFHNPPVAVAEPIIPPVGIGVRHALHTARQLPNFGQLTTATPRRSNTHKVGPISTPKWVRFTRCAVIRLGFSAGVIPDR